MTSMFNRNNSKIVQPIVSKSLSVQIWSRPNQQWLISFEDDDKKKVIIVSEAEAKALAIAFNIQAHDTDIMYHEQAKKLVERLYK